MRAFVGGFVIVLVGASVAVAQPARTFVSSLGLDSNPCSRSQPCRNFNAAVIAVAAGGEVVALDSAGYGPVRIDKAVSLISPTGVYAGITAVTGSGITIDIPFEQSSEAYNVIIRGVSINGLGAADGITLGQYGALLGLENVSLSGFGEPGFAIHVRGVTRLWMQGCEIHHVSEAIRVDDTIFFSGMINDTRFAHVSSTAIYLWSGSQLLVRDSVFFYVLGGILLTPSAGPSEITLENCVMSDGRGIFLAANSPSSATARLSGTMITQTGYVLRKAGTGTNTFLSFGNNHFDANTNEGSFDSVLADK